jgi:hypothetical protein
MTGLHVTPRPFPGIEPAPADDLGQVAGEALAAARGALIHRFPALPGCRFIDPHDATCGHPEAPTPECWRLPDGARSDCPRLDPCPPGCDCRLTLHGGIPARPGWVHERQVLGHCVVCDEPARSIDPDGDVRHPVACGVPA